MRIMPVLLLTAFAAFAGITPVQGAERCEPSAQQVALRAGPCAEQRSRTLRALTARTQVLLKASADRKAAGHAENRRRCHTAVQVAALCGTPGEGVYCGESGFLPASPAGEVAQERPVVSNGRRYQMQLCSLQATRGER
jgi:hypothetical protein